MPQSNLTDCNALQTPVFNPLKNSMNALDALATKGLYRPEFEHDNCGFGLIAQIDGESSHQLVKSAVQALARICLLYTSPSPRDRG